MRVAMGLAGVIGLVGCDDASPLVSGDYDLVDWVATLEPEESVDPLPNVGLVLDAAAGTATFVDGDEEIRLGFVSRARGEWPAQCPTNFTSSLVEVADLDADLELDGRTVAAPFLMAECRGGERVYVGPSAGAGAGFQGAGPCRNGGACLVFERS